MSNFNIMHPREQRLVCQTLVAATKNTSDSMQQFVQWMLAGFGAGLTFLLGNLDRVQHYIAFQNIKTAGILFLLAAGLGVFQRYLAMLIKTGTGVFQESEKLPAEGVDIVRFFIIYLSALPPSVRFAGAWSARSFLRGNITEVGRWLFITCFVQCSLGAISALLLLCALGIILLNIGVSVS